MPASSASWRSSIPPAITGWNRASGWSGKKDQDNAKDKHQGPRILQSQHRVEARDAAMAVQGQHENQDPRVPRQGWAADARIRRHHASRHAYGRADPCAGEYALHHRLRDLAVL